MGFFDSLRALVNSVDTEYDRRIRSASNVRQYNIGGHAGHASHSHAGPQTGHDDRLQGEGGALGDLQANAGPHLEEHHEHGTEEANPPTP